METMDLIDWEKASAGAWQGLPIGHAPSRIRNMQYALTANVQRICDQQFHDQEGGTFDPLPIREMQPTFESGWDYEWPTEYPNESLEFFKN